MPFNWNDFLSLARRLATSTADEASQRTAISRAYYCIFNLAFARVEATVGPKPKNEGYHQWCWRQYKGTPDHACVKLGNTGERLKRMRVQADYSPVAGRRLDDEVRRVLNDARQFLIDLNALDPRYPGP